jgi:hypothetical protein
MRETRQFRRWKASIPCTIQWEHQIFQGQIYDLSLGGVLVTEVNAIPPGDATVTVEFHYHQEGILVDARVECRVARTIQKFAQAGQLGAFGLEFERPLEKTRTQLVALIRVLSGEWGQSGRIVEDPYLAHLY